MDRVMIIGNAGGGKSRLARHLSTRHHLPLTEIDRIRWRPGWVRVPEDEFTALHARLIATDRWVIDGWGSWDSVVKRLDASDTIIFVDLPFRQHLIWALKRQATSFLTRGRDDPEGCPRWPHTRRLLRMMRSIDRDDLPRLRAEIAKRTGRARVIHIRSRADLDAYTRNEKGPGA
jgi:hypothetical protein